MSSLLLSFAVLCSIAQSPLEERLDSMKGTVLVKLQRLRSENVKPTKVHFKDELAKLDELARAAHGTDPDVEVAVLLFEGNLLGDQLKELSAAVACYDRVLGLSGLEPYARSHALIEKASLLRLDHRLPELQAMVKEYLAAPDHDAALGKHLEAIVRRGELVRGTEFPAFSGSDLAGKPFAIPVRDHGPSILAFVRLKDGRDLAEVSALDALLEKTPGLPVLVASIDLDSTSPAAALKDHPTRCTVTWQGGPADGTLANRCGIQETPLLFVLDAEGKILGEVGAAADVPALLAKARRG